jgi:hypothetical protein
MEKEYVTVVMDPNDFGYLRLLVRRMGFEEKFARPGPSRVRGRQEDRRVVYASFVRNGNGGAERSRGK